MDLEFNGVFFLVGLVFKARAYVLIYSYLFTKATKDDIAYVVSCCV